MRFYGVVGFYFGDEEIRPGVFRPKIVERTYNGELTNYHVRWQGSEHQDDNLTISQNISILSDPYAYEHWPAIKFIEFNGARWAVSSIEIAYPRLILTVGGVYNGITGPSTTP